MSRSARSRPRTPPLRSAAADGGLTAPDPGPSAGFAATHRLPIVPAVIRAILHLLNDQPLSVELLDEPKPGDAAVICTNVRTIDGKRPVFVDFSDSTFVFPMASVRFLEVPSGVTDADRARTAAATAAANADEAEDLEIDEDFLRRVREA